MQIIIEPQILLVVAGFIILDIITGFSQACVNHTVSSVKMREGLWHKSAYFFAIALAMLCEYGTLYLNLGFTTPITLPVCAFICLTEIVSVLENLGKLNPDILGSSLAGFFANNQQRRRDD